MIECIQFKLVWLKNYLSLEFKITLLVPVMKDEMSDIKI